jgi:hypothetical protein
MYTHRRHLLFKRVSFESICYWRRMLIKRISFYPAQKRHRWLKSVSHSSRTRNLYQIEFRVTSHPSKSTSFYPLHHNSKPYPDSHCRHRTLPSPTTSNEALGSGGSTGVEARFGFPAAEERARAARLPGGGGACAGQSDTTRTLLGQAAPRCRPGEVKSRGAD